MGATFPPPNIPNAMATPTVATNDGQYDYVTTSDPWKWACAELPSCMAVQWPGYATAAFKTQINGRDAIIQPWMGECQKFLGKSNWPGGFGGEVAVYVCTNRGAGAPASPLLPSWINDVLKAFSLIGGDQIWWPDPDIQPAIEFTIINPIDHSILVRSAEQKTYWNNKWMQPASYAKYRDLHHVPSDPSHYKMVFTVDGHTQAWSPGLSVP